MKSIAVTQITKVGGPRFSYKLWLSLTAAIVAIVISWYAGYGSALLAIAPWLLILACPLMHLFMHGSHAHGDQKSSDIGCCGGGHRHHDSGAVRDQPATASAGSEPNNSHPMLVTEAKSCCAQTKIVRDKSEPSQNVERRKINIA